MRLVYALIIALTVVTQPVAAQTIGQLPAPEVTIPAACAAGLGAFAAAAGATFPISVPVIVVAVAICSITAETVVE